MTVLDQYMKEGPFAGRRPGTERWSVLDAAVRDARAVTGRDVSTGQVVDEEHTQTWIGLLGYLTLLDQLGTAVRPVTCPSPGSAVWKRFHLALEQFGGVADENDRAALYGLRNALVHDFSLVDRSSQPRLFALCSDRANWLVHHPDVAWDGGFPIRTGGATVVNVREVGETVERAIRTARHEQTAGRLISEISDDELRHRYFMEF